MDEPWRIELLGWLRAVRADQVVSRFRTRQAGTLLAYLAYYPHRSHPREVLIELHWPQRSPAAGRNRLSQALTSLRRQLEPAPVAEGAVIQASRATVQLNPAAYTTDVRQFQMALEAAAAADSVEDRIDWLTRATDLYRGELLPGHFDGWILSERQRLAEAFVHAAGQLAALSEAAGELWRAIQLMRRVVSAEPLSESDQFRLIRLLAAAGQRGMAVRQYGELERLLQQECGLSPDARLRALREAIEGDSGVGEGERREETGPVDETTASVRDLPPSGGAAVGTDGTPS